MAKAGCATAARCSRAQCDVGTSAATTTGGAIADYDVTWNDCSDHATYYVRCHVFTYGSTCECRIDGAVVSTFTSAREVGDCEPDAMSSGCDFKIRY